VRPPSAFFSRECVRSCEDLRCKTKSAGDTNHPSRSDPIFVIGCIIPSDLDNACYDNQLRQPVQRVGSLWHLLNILQLSSPLRSGSDC
jgi:hypothetical protein